MFRFTTALTLLFLYVLGIVILLILQILNSAIHYL